jgi:hypothetical protein
MSTVLCITGMHRSGTSLVTSWLEQCGLAIHDGRVLGPYSGNPKGHFEDLDFYELQSAAILRLDQASFGWKLRGVEPRAFDDDHLAAALSLIEKRNLKYPLWGWKDPRSVIYLDQWKRLIPSLKVLLLWRPCAEVAASLVSRSGSQESYPGVHVELNEAVRLWTDYGVRMCAYKTAHSADTVLCDVHSAVGHDRELLQEISDRLGLPLNYVPIARLFDKAIFGKEPGAVASAVSAREDVWRLQKELAERSSPCVPAVSPSDHETVSGGAEFQALLDDVSAMLGKRDVRIHSLAQQVRDHESTIQQQRAQIEEGLQQAAELARQLAAQQEVICNLTAELDRLRDHPLFRAYQGAKRLVAGRRGR